MSDKKKEFQISVEVGTRHLHQMVIDWHIVICPQYTLTHSLTYYATLKQLETKSDECLALLQEWYQDGSERESENIAEARQQVIKYECVYMYVVLRNTSLH